MESEPYFPSAGIVKIIDAERVAICSGGAARFFSKRAESMKAQLAGLGQPDLPVRAEDAVIPPGLVSVGEKKAEETVLVESVLIAQNGKISESLADRKNIARGRPLIRSKNRSQVIFSGNFSGELHPALGSMIFRVWTAARR